MNRLKVSLQQSILALHSRGWSARRIARELGIHRETVSRHVQAPKPANVTIGYEADQELQNQPQVTIGSEEPKPAKVTHGTRSACEPFRSVIEQGLAGGLSATRIYQDLVADCGYSGAYESVKRFVRALEVGMPLPARRIETGPGKEVQVDFGLGAWVEIDGKKRRPHVFRAVLGFSRKGYSEVVWKQDTESFLRCLENAFRHFGGVPACVIPDNLKAAVLLADWFDPELNPKMEAFARYYGTVVLPTKPRTPQHKGKVEAGIKYVQNNALKARRFASLGEQNQFLEYWERNVADKRLHGTLRQQVGTVFEQERAALLPLPDSLFPSFVEAKRKVHRDGYIEYRRAYYSVPPECVGRDVWIRAESRVLRIYTLQMRDLAVHTLVEPGRFATHDAHIHPHKRNGIERGAAHLLDRCRLLGPNCGQWAEAMFQNRGPMGQRVMQGLLSLARKHSYQKLEDAAQIANRHGSFRLRDLRRLMDQGDTVIQVDFLQEHPLIRDMSAYGLEHDPFV